MHAVWTAHEAVDVGAGGLQPPASRCRPQCPPSYSSGFPRVWARLVSRQRAMHVSACGGTRGGRRLKFFGALSRRSSLGGVPRTPFRVDTFRVLWSRRNASGDAGSRPAGDGSWTRSAWASPYVSLRQASKLVSPAPSRGSRVGPGLGSSSAVRTTWNHSIWTAAQRRMVALAAAAKPCTGPQPHVCTILGGQQATVHSKTLRAPTTSAQVVTARTHLEHRCMQDSEEGGVHVPPTSK